MNNFNGFSCKCPIDWAGFNCNLPVTKKLLLNCLNEANKCQNGGSCLKNLNEIFYSCKCPLSFTGKSCEISTATICDSKPCKNNGKCVALSQTSYECNCFDNHIGKQCESFNYCKNVSCGHGNCINLNDGYKCSCDINFTGNTCDSCVTGYSGANCKEFLTFCTPNPCLNGICVWDSYGFKCICTEGKLRFLFN